MQMNDFWDTVGTWWYNNEHRVLWTEWGGYNVQSCVINMNSSTLLSDKRLDNLDAVAYALILVEFIYLFNN